MGEFPSKCENDPVFAITLALELIFPDAVTFVIAVMEFVVLLNVNPASPPNDPPSLNCTCVSDPPGVPPPPPPPPFNACEAVRAYEAVNVFTIPGVPAIDPDKLIDPVTANDCEYTTLYKFTTSEAVPIFKVFPFPETVPPPKSFKVIGVPAPPISISPTWLGFPIITS